ncbi:MAG: hypothetical protein IT378_25900 [Sandaracinaceae bacterium]|nr:hypothetical protein [Sandaracinaceae bacterium]
MGLRFALLLLSVAPSVALAQPPRSSLPSWLEAPGAEQALDRDPVLTLGTERRPPRSSARPAFSELYWRALAGQAIGAAGGALIGLAIAAASGCTNDEGWLSGYSCQAGLGYAATIGALLAAPLGTATGIVLGGIALDRRRDAGEAYLFSALGMLPGALAFALTYASQDQLTMSFLLGALVAGGLSPLFGTLGYQGNQAPTARLALAPTPTPGGLGLAASGSF